MSILGTLLSWIYVGMIVSFHELLPLPWSWMLDWFSFWTWPWYLGKKLFGCRPFSGVVALFLPLLYALLSFLMLSFTCWEFAVAHVTISGGLISNFVCKLISVLSCVCLYPSVFCVPVFFLQCDGLLSDFFYDMISNFLGFEGVQG